jgi:hypothetical protein
LVIGVICDWAIKISSIGLEALSPSTCDLDTSLGLNFSFDSIAVSIFVNVHTQEKSMCVVISNCLLSGTCDSIVMLVDTQNIKHVVS